MSTLKLNVSAELLEILNQIKDSSLIAQNLIDLTSDINTHQVNDDYPDYLSLSEDNASMFSYLTPQRMEIFKLSPDFESEVWNSKRRFKSRPAALVQKIFSKVNGRDLEIFNNVYKAALGLTKFSFKIVQGEDIKRYYHQSLISESRGSLFASCMKYDHCQDFLDIYVDNEDIIEMLIMQDTAGRVMGRALLWNLGDVKIMDRIYTINDEELPYHFKMWAQKNAYLYKPVQKWNNTLDFVENGQTVKKRLEVKLKYSKYSKYPYLDTFKFLDSKSGIISNYKTDNTDKILINAEGGFNNRDAITEDFLDGIYYHHCEMARIEYDSETGKMREEPVWTYNNNAKWSSTNEMYILTQDLIYDRSIDDYLFVEKLDHLNKKTNTTIITDSDSVTKIDEAISEDASSQPGLSVLDRIPRSSFEFDIAALRELLDQAQAVYCDTRTGEQRRSVSSRRWRSSSENPSGTER